MGRLFRRHEVTDCKTGQQKVRIARIGGGIHAFRAGSVSFEGTVVLAISSPVVASWLETDCAIFLDLLELKYREDD